MPGRDLTPDRNAMRALHGQRPLPAGRGQRLRKRLAPAAMAFTVAGCSAWLFPMSRGIGFVYLGCAVALFFIRRAAQDIGPPPVARTPRDWRTDLSPADPANRHLLTVCPVCGGIDLGKFRIGLERVVKWREWPAHEYCVEWLGPEERADRPASAEHLTPWASPLRVAGADGMAVLIERIDGTLFSVLVPHADIVHSRIDALCDVGQGTPRYLEGTPSPSPVAPACPTQPIALINVPPGCTQIGRRDVLCLDWPHNDRPRRPYLKA